MEKIKLANETISHLKDYVEVRKALKKMVVAKSKATLEELNAYHLDSVEIKVKELKGE